MFATTIQNQRWNCYWSFLAVLEILDRAGDEGEQTAQAHSEPLYKVETEQGSNSRFIEASLKFCFVGTHHQSWM
jgi:hypothetical protein